MPKKMVTPLTLTPVATVTPTPPDRIQADTPAVPEDATPTPLSRQPTEPVEEPAPLQVASLDLPVAVPPVSEKATIAAPSLSIQRADNSLIPSPTNPVDRLVASKSMVRANASRELERQLREEAGPETVIAQATFETPAELAKASPPASATLASKTLAKLVANPTREPAQSVHLPIPAQPVTL
ncbi:TPA: hypothetical protein EYP38_01740, partial [Candidatus Micrarchaeota archaeon]|nr:hypothetical protein [Candidatus Micrarchaeota archaeon]